MDTFQDTLDLAFGELDLQNDQLEGLLKSSFTAGANALKASQVIDQNKGDLDVTNYLRGMKSLAQVVGTTNQSLSTEQAQKVREAVSDLIDVKDNPLLTGALEALFGYYLDLVYVGKQLRAYADTLAEAAE
jgi:hypothetical protein